MSINHYEMFAFQCSHKCRLLIHFDLVSSWLLSALWSYGRSMVTSMVFLSFCWGFAVAAVVSGPEAHGGDEGRGREHSTYVYDEMDREDHICRQGQ